MEPLTYFIIIFSVFIFFAIIMVCIGCYRKRKRQALFSTPVVVTSQTYQQPSGGQVPYPVSLTTTTNANMNQMNYQPPMQPPISHQNIPMAMPMPNSNLHYTHYPPASSSSAPYPLASSTAPYPTNTTAPYPPSTYSTPYPTKNPYNDQSSQVHPPTYSQAVDSGTFEQQPAFNPTYKH